jgi:type I restriction enzyme S subunit
MMEEIKGGWKYKRLDELGFIGRGKSRHRPRNDPSLYNGEYPFIQTADVKNAELYVKDYSQTYNERGLAQSKLWPKGTLCITIAANIAETAILGLDACFPDSIVGFIPNKEKTDVKFIKYYLDTAKIKMQQISKGTTQDNLSIDKLLTVKVLLPPHPIQRKIAAILSAYDDLIENNTRRILILEAMAQTIYKEWFVKFRFPGHEKVKMVDSELGHIPEGWEVKRLGEIVELAYGKALKKDDRMDGPFSVYGSSGVVGYHDEYLVQGPGIIVGRKGNVGSVFWSQKSFYPIDTVFFVKTDMDLYYVYYNLKEQNFINNDAAVPGLSRNQAYLNKFLLPSNYILRRFNNVTSPLFDQIEHLQSQIENLHRTRDLLLPKLISGEIDVEWLRI